MPDERLGALAREVALELPGSYAERGRKNLGEQFHLQPVTDRVLQRLLPDWGPGVALSASKMFGKSLGWVGLGPVDLSFRVRDQLATVLELKCGHDLSACAWDAVKLAAGVLDCHADSAYMLAGAPTAMWDKPTPGADLFSSASWLTMGPKIRDAHMKWWRAWQEETVAGRPNRHIPGLVSAAFETVALGSFPFQIDATPWELRLARVKPHGSKAIVWKCV